MNPVCMCVYLSHGLAHQSCLVSGLVVAFCYKQVGSHILWDLDSVYEDNIMYKDLKSLTQIKFQSKVYLNIFSWHLKPKNRQIYV